MKITGYLFRSARFVLVFGSAMIVLVGANALASDAWDFIRNVMQNKVQEVEHSLNNGMDVNTRSPEDGNTGLHWSASLGLKEMTILFVSHGADINLKNRDGNTALHFAAGQGNREVVKILISHGADINAKGKLNWTPLRWAEETDHAAIADMLRAAGARL